MKANDTFFDTAEYKAPASIFKLCLFLTLPRSISGFQNTVGSFFQDLSLKGKATSKIKCVKTDWERVLFSFSISLFRRYLGPYNIEQATRRVAIRCISIPC